MRRSRRVISSPVPKGLSPTIPRSRRCKLRSSSPAKSECGGGSSRCPHKARALPQCVSVGVVILVRNADPTLTDGPLAVPLIVNLAGGCLDHAGLSVGIVAKDVGEGVHAAPVSREGCAG